MLTPSGKTLLEHLVAAQAVLARHCFAETFGEMPLNATDFAVGWERSRQYRLLLAADDALRPLITALETADRTVQP